MSGDRRYSYVSWGEKKDDETRGKKKRTNRFHTRKDTKLFRAAILRERSDGISRTSNTRPAFCQSKKKTEKKKKEKKPNKEKKIGKMADEMQIYSLHGEKSTGAKVCAEKVSLRQRQVITYTHEGGIQGGGELPGRDLRLGRHLSEWPWLAESPSPCFFSSSFSSTPFFLLFLPGFLSYPCTFVSLIDAMRARVARNIRDSAISHACCVCIHMYISSHTREIMIHANFSSTSSEVQEQIWRRKLIFQHDRFVWRIRNNLLSIYKIERSSLSSVEMDILYWKLYSKCISLLFSQN